MVLQSHRSRAPFHFVRYHLPVILYSAAILGVSSLTNISAPEVRLIALDKLAHFLEYALFAYICFRSFSHIGRAVSVNLAYLLTILFVSFFAVGDEYYQSFIPGRVMDGNDLLMDIVGAVLVATFFWLRRRRMERSTAFKSGEQDGPR